VGLAGLHQIYELNLSPKSVKSRLINLHFCGTDKAGRLNLALKFNGKTIKIYVKPEKTNRKMSNLAKAAGKARLNEPRRKNERNPHKYRPCRDADFIYVGAGILSHHLPSVVFL